MSPICAEWAAALEADHCAAGGILSHTGPAATLQPIEQEHAISQERSVGLANRG
jgi:hypothetical protein